MLGTNIFGPGAAEGAAIATVTVGIYAFCLIFAVNSAVHSYLIVRYSEGDKVSLCLEQACCNSVPSGSSCSSSSVGH